MTASFPTPAGYRVLERRDISAIVAEVDTLADKLGGTPDDWETSEISDGNMNAVFRVSGPEGSIVVKQALPYIRVIGEGWPFPVSRIAFEAEALERQLAALPGSVPEKLHYDESLGLLVMEDLSGYRVARLAFVKGRRFANFAEDMGAFLAHTLYRTSDFHLTTPQKKALAAGFAGNSHLCQTTEEVIFTGPYGERPFNRITEGNEEIAVRLREDSALKQAASEMKLAFRTKSEALLHGDLHTGSVMVTDTETRVIDAEWAFHGPMGFDPGALIGNLLLAAISQPGHADAADDRRAMTDWLLETAKRVWIEFDRGFRRLASEDRSEIFPHDILDAAARDAIVDRHLAAVFEDMVGFAGAKMIRRILGISHVEDFEAIGDVAMRAQLERHALRVARRLLLERREIADMDRVLAVLAEER
ncbi:S-methyl-5-thioribose kinase [Fulvimarina endophytica]|uniref:S-methyl-5-thioribose kinase n=1 Tax=Fulvimarina endophytica TaxID=2293836 RepID=A0A371WZE5_9HYPH|nr:S-methyl-5-thioribose kinase [Fulvimarina endophytica]RFC62355.1 S-methyl-5-thioribose kinase [Fulvimarina endophytica]